MGNDVMAMAAFSAAEEGRMRLELELRNPSDEARQWEFSFYIVPCGGLEISQDYPCEVSHEHCRLNIDGLGFELKGEGISFRDAAVGDSNFWINFPLNAECIENEDNPRNRYKKRLKLRTRWIDVPARSKLLAAIDFLPDGTAGTPEKFIPAAVAGQDLPYRYAHWEALHNRQYVRKFSAPETMEIRHLPARQWGRFYILDCGMTAAGLATEDAGYAEEIIASIPYPADSDAAFKAERYLALYERNHAEPLCCWEQYAPTVAGAPAICVFPGSPLRLSPYTGRTANRARFRPDMTCGLSMPASMSPEQYWRFIRHSSAA